MDSNTHQIYNHNSQPSSGLLRFRSAPSSLIANFTENGVVEKTGGFETDRLISRFMSSDGVNGDLGSPNLRDFEDKSPVTVTDAAVTYAATSEHQQQSYSGLPPHYPRQNGAVGSSAMDGSYQFLAMSNNQQKSLDSNLLRQSSSPAGLFTNLPVHNGYVSMKNMLSYGPDGELSPSSKGSKRHCSLSQRPPSSLGMLSQTSEIGNENLAFRFQYGHWNGPSSFMENYAGVKRELDGEGRLFSATPDTKNGELGNHIHLLSHHLSLPKASSEMVAMKKFLQFQDSVPCKIRAKRGCATHPRSIAERVRRTRISERMRKLQELVPNMDKQMNTADMLDLAVEYIKNLQRQFKILSDNRANCKCMNTEKKPIQNHMV